MTLEKWQEIVDKIHKQYQVLAEEAGSLTPDPGTFINIAFKLPLGEFKLELRTTPRVLNKKTHYNNRAGASTTVEYVYDDKESVLTLHAYKMVGGEWEEVSAGNFSNGL